MTEPSKVLHVRNVGQEITESDLLGLVQPFGSVSKMVLLRTKNQALLQMQDVNAAISAMQYYTSVQPSVRGRNVYIQFSSHQELTTSDQATQPRRPAGDQDQQPNRILLVTIHHPLYPITVDVLHQVFNPHGHVEKIVTFQKSAGLQALIQYNNQQSAVYAKSLLQGRNIYDGCCTLDIQFSNLQELQVNFNNERTRDYTNSSLPNEPGRSQNPPGGNNMMVPMTPSAAAAAAASGGTLPPGVTGTNERCTLLVSNLAPEKVDADKLFNLFSNYGNIIRIKMLHNKPDHALIQMGDGYQAELAVYYLRGTMLFEKRMEVNFSKHSQINPSQDTHDYSSSNLNRFNRNALKNYKYCCSPTKMIHVSSLPTDITEVDLMNHLSPHGNILNVKIFEANGKKQALVHFDNEEQATEALVCKHATVVKKSTVRLAFSKLSNI
ncbi:hypothetical protein SELMODRAFT_173175 [Selaginella moellendorffii]|uniref:RRM domain-containing protein n=1 Tax=Selaginella moellendorffii TaxID=88036 RepID=D8RQL5_SELML|nr:hypothetical protein SELMODRAFT_105564 [Selaginella moellendorffii]EFJ25472.1 hypothetical protein SELMODRAFT_173175 [Selaginella moellendorffii]